MTIARRASVTASWSPGTAPTHRVVIAGHRPHLRQRQQPARRVGHPGAPLLRIVRMLPRRRLEDPLARRRRDQGAAGELVDELLEDVVAAPAEAGPHEVVGDRAPRLDPPLRLLWVPLDQGLEQPHAAQPQAEIPQVPVAGRSLDLLLPPLHIRLVGLLPVLLPLDGDRAVLGPVGVDGPEAAEPRHGPAHGGRDDQPLDQEDRKAHPVRPHNGLRAGTHPSPLPAGARS